MRVRAWQSCGASGANAIEAALEENLGSINFIGWIGCIRFTNMGCIVLVDLQPPNSYSASLTMPFNFLCSDSQPLTFMSYKIPLPLTPLPNNCVPLAPPSLSLPLLAHFPSLPHQMNFLPPGHREEVKLLVCNNNVKGGSTIIGGGRKKRRCACKSRSHPSSHEYEVMWKKKNLESGSWI